MRQTEVIELRVHGEAAQLKRMNEAMFKMKKLGIAKLQQAYNGQ